MAKKKNCNCKAKRDVDSLIKNIEDINKSSSLNKTKKENNVRNIIFNIVKVIVYLIIGALSLIGFIPLILYIVLSKKQITIKLPKLNNNNG